MVVSGIDSLRPAGQRPMHAWFLKIAFVQEAGMRVCMCAHMCVHVFVCMRVCMHMHVYTPNAIYNHLSEMNLQ